MHYRATQIIPQHGSLTIKPANEVHPPCQVILTESVILTLRFPMENLMRVSYNLLKKVRPPLTMTAQCASKPVNLISSLLPGTHFLSTTSSRRLCARHSFFFFFFFLIGLSRCSNHLPIHPGFWPTNNITIHIVHVIA